jgi:hypothetical protein
MLFKYYFNHKLSHQLAIFTIYIEIEVRVTREWHADVALDAPITRIAPNVRSALHSMGYFCSRGLLYV